ncbi:hypothetical protein ACOMHN_041993 [Nucella lapillus]
MAGVVLLAILLFVGCQLVKIWQRRQEASDTDSDKDSEDDDRESPEPDVYGHHGDKGTEPLHHLSKSVSVIQVTALGRRSSRHSSSLTPVESSGMVGTPFLQSMLALQENDDGRNSTAVPELPRSLTTLSRTTTMLTDLSSSPIITPPPFPPPVIPNTPPISTSHLPSSPITPPPPPPPPVIPNTPPISTLLHQQTDMKETDSYH